MMDPLKESILASILYVPSVEGIPAPADIFSYEGSPKKPVAGGAVTSPFGAGCVGTSSICGLANSRATVSEQETLHRDAQPSLWRDKDDDEYWEAFNRAGPSERLQSFYRRLGGEAYEFKRTLSEAELLRRMRDVELQGKARRQKYATPAGQNGTVRASEPWSATVRKDEDGALQAQLIAYAFKAGGSLQLFRADRPVSDPMTSATAAVASPGTPRVRSEEDVGSTTRPSGVLYKRGAPQESPERKHPTRDTEYADGSIGEDEAFHARMRKEYSRPWTKAQLV
ncbi:unnamed protein product [Parajaminaea phylloscopi]